MASLSDFSKETRKRQVTFAIKLTIPLLCPATSSFKLIFLFTFFIMKETNPEGFRGTTAAKSSLLIGTLTYFSESNK